METRTVRTSTILISSGGQTRLFRSRSDVPVELREKLDESLASSTAATVLIADQKGRDEIMKLLRGEPSVLEKSSGVLSRKARRTAAAKAESQRAAEDNKGSISGLPAWLSKRWFRALVAFVLPAIAGALFYALLTSPR